MAFIPFLANPLRSIHAPAISGAPSALDASAISKSLLSLLALHTNCPANGTPRATLARGPPRSVPRPTASRILPPGASMRHPCLRWRSLIWIQPVRRPPTRGQPTDAADRIRLTGVTVRDRRIVRSAQPAAHGRRPPARGVPLPQRTTAIPEEAGSRQFRVAIGERDSAGRGMFAVTKSDGKHAPARIPTNAAADERPFVAVQASGSDESE
jgi:hypothetical protein